MTKLWTVDDVAEYLSLTKDTVRLWARTGRIRGVNVGSSGRPTWRFDPSQFFPLGSPEKTGGIPEQSGSELSPDSTADRING